MPSKRKPAKPIPPPDLSKVMAYLGSKGGKAGTGKSKARTSEQARAAIRARWDKERPKPSE